MNTHASSHSTVLAAFWLILGLSAAMGMLSLHVKFKPIKKSMEAFSMMVRAFSPH